MKLNPSHSEYRFRILIHSLVGAFAIPVTALCTAALPASLKLTPFRPLTLAQNTLVPFSLPIPAVGAFQGVSSVSSADINGDGKLDLVAGAYEGSRIAWFRNNGDGTFGAEQTIDPASESVWFTKSADLNGDNHPDVIGGMYSGTLAWYENNGSGSFTKHVIDTDNVGPWLEIGDLNGDGRNDLLAGPDGGSTLYFYRGLSTGGFAPRTELVSGFQGLGGIALRDLNADGRKDLVVGDYRADQILYFINQGEGQLGPKQSLQGGDGSGLAAVVDLDQDQKPDILALEYNAERVSWYRNLNGTQFGPRLEIPVTLSGPYAVAASDLDKDGSPDIVVGTYSNLPDLVWCRNDGQGNFQAPLLISRDFGQISSIDAADYDSDGDPDLAVGSFSGSQIHILKNQIGENATVIVPPAAGRYLRGQAIDVGIYFGVPVAVTGFPTLDLQVGTEKVAATYVGGSGTPLLTFRYVVKESDLDADGVSLTSTQIQPAGGGILDPHGDTVNPVLQPTTWSSVLVAGSAPFVVSVLRNSPNPTDAETVRFKVVFSEPVSGLDLSDIRLIASSGIQNPALLAVEGQSDTYLITARSTGGSGTLGIEIPSSASLQGQQGFPLGSTFSGGEIFTVLRGPAQTITNFYRAGHGDIAIGFGNNQWNIKVKSDLDGEFNADNVLIYGGAEALQKRGAGSAFDFLGVPTDAPIYVWDDRGSIPTLPELGIGGGGIPGGTLASYFNHDPRLNASAPWASIRMTAVRVPQGAQLSVYTVSSFGQPVVWWATSDGIDDKDVVTIIEGSHQHYNFAFTHPGIYEVDVIVSGFRDANGNGLLEPGIDPYVESALQTLYLGVDLPGGVQPHVVLAGMGGRTPLPAFTFESFALDAAAETLLSDINSQGDLVGHYKDGLGLSSGFVQSGTNVHRFNLTGTTATFPGGMNSLGAIAGFYRNATNPSIQHGFIRDTNGVITTIDGEVAGTTYVWRINDQGEANGYWFEESPFFIRSFRRDTNGILTTFVYPGSPVGTVTRGMNEAGDLAGWKWTDAFALQGVLFHRSGLTNVFTVPGWANTLPGDINNLGETAGTVINADFTQRAGFFRRANGQTVVFTPPQAIEVEVFGLNDEGEIVGEYVNTSGARLGFIARPATRIDNGHVDAGLAFEDGAFEFHVHDEENDIEHAVDKAVLAIGTAAEQTIPDEVAYSFLGRPGYSTWILPAVQNENLPFLGLAAEEIEPGIFEGNQIRVELVFVQGSGEFALYSLDSLGNPVIHMNTADGYDDQDVFILQAGSHVDLNWAFSAPGTYRVGLRARAKLAATGAEIESDVAYYTFTVPAPLRTQPTEPVEVLYTITDIGTLGGTASFALDINEMAQVTGNARYTNSNSRLHAFAWNQEIIQDLGYLTNGVEFSRGYAINDAGLIVGESDNDVSKAFLWDGQTMIQLETLGGSSAVAHDINNQGEIVGASSNGSASRPYKRDANGVMQDLGTLLGTTTSSGRAWSINEQGVVVGLSRNAADTTSQATLWISGSISNLGSLGDGTLFSQAYALNDNNLIVGSSVVGKVSPTSSTDLYHAFVWKDGVMSDLGAHPSHSAYIHSEAKDVNNAGDIVGYAARFFSSPTSGGAAMLWRNGEAIDLNTLIPANSGWVLQSAEGINDKGDIVGYGSFKGQTRAYLLRRATIYSQGHADFAFDYSNNTWRSRMRIDGLSTNLIPATIVVRGNVASEVIVPPDLPPGYEFLGNAGDILWILPEVQDPRLPYLGFAAEETGLDTFLNRSISVQLLQVEGPGHFILSDAGFTEPRVFINTKDGITSADVFPLTTGSHAHLNWIFTRPGYYRITLQPTGTLAPNGVTITGTPVTCHFQIIGIQTSLSLAAADTGLKLTFATQDGVQYQMESSTEASGPWEPTGQPFVGTGRLKEISISKAPTRAFFRVQATIRN